MTDQTQSEPLLLDINRAALVVGVSISTIRTWSAEGLPFVRGGPGGRKMYRRRDLERHIERRMERTE
jgi:DNA-binding transcriptional MerR regulator